MSQSQFDQKEELNLVVKGEKPTHYLNPEVVFTDKDGKETRIAMSNARMPLGGNFEKRLTAVLVAAYEANPDVEIKLIGTINPNAPKQLDAELKLA